MQIKAYKNKIILIGIVLFFVLANLLWLQKDKAPPMWDQAQYLESSQILYKVLTTEGVVPFAEAYSTVLREKAPLIAMLPIPSYLLFGNDYRSARFVNIFFIILGSIYLYRLGILIAGEEAALLSIIVLNTFPLIAGISREILVDYGLMVFVIMWMYYLLKSECFTDRQYNYRLGIVFGLGMLMKISFPVYIAAPTFFLLWNTISQKKKLPELFFKNILIVFVVGVLIAGTWYFNNLETISKFAFRSGYGDAARNWSMGEVFSIETIIVYWTYLINYGISFYFFLCLLFILILRFVNSLKNNSSPGSDSFYTFFLFFWFLLPFLVFTFGVNKDYRFTAPYYPAIALFISMNLAKLFQKRYRNAVLLFFLLFPVFNYIFISFSPKPYGLQVQKFKLLETNLGYAHPPIKDRWPLRSVVNFIHNDAMRTNNEFAVTTLLFNNLYFNSINMRYYAAIGNSGMMFNNVSPNLDAGEAVSKIERESSYLITKSDKLGPEFTISKNMPVLAMLNSGKMNFRQILTLPLPDGTSLTVFKRDTRDFVYSSISEIRDFKIEENKVVNFSDKVRLLDFKYEKKNDKHKIIFLWQCIDRVDMNYRIFVHVKNINDNPVANADHCPGKKIYPTSYWRRGEVIRDEIYIASNLPDDFHVDIGIYEDSFNKRLLVKDRPGDHQDNIRGIRIF